jgi:transposase-like protein
MATVVSKVDDQAATQLAAKQQYWLDHVRQCQASGQSMAAYARDQGLASKSFYRWRSQLLALQSENAAPIPEQFHRVQITPPAPAFRIPTKTMAVLLRLPNGIECELRQVDIQTCADLLSALSKTDS